MEFGPAEMKMGCSDEVSPEKQHWRLWCLLVFVTIINVAVLISSQLLLYSGLITNDWPWQNTHLSLIVVLSLGIIGFITYLTIQKKKILNMERQLRVFRRVYDKRLNRNTARFVAISNVSRKMCDECDPQRIFKYITKTCTKLFRCDRASLMMLDEKTGELVVCAVSPIQEDHYSGARQKVGEGISGWAAESRKAILLRRDTDSSKFSDLKANIDRSISAMVVPIVLRDELVGVINVRTNDPDVEYEEDDLNALQVFAENAGAFIRHSEKAEWMRKTIEKLGRISTEAGSKCGCVDADLPGA